VLRAYLIPALRSYSLNSISNLIPKSMDTTSTVTAAVAEFTKEITNNIDSTNKVPASHANPVVAFIIGLAIILLASILNAAGLNLTKLDHVSCPSTIFDSVITSKGCFKVRASTVPKAVRKKDWLRPLWLLGMLLYMYATESVIQVFTSCSFTITQPITINRKHPCPGIHARRICCSSGIDISGV